MDPSKCRRHLQGPEVLEIHQTQMQSLPISCFRSMLGYLALWCTVVLKIEEPWETKHPKAIPVMAIVGFSTARYPESVP